MKFNKLIVDEIIDYSIKVIIGVGIGLFISFAFCGCTHVAPNVSVQEYLFTTDGMHVDCKIYCCQLFAPSRSGLGLKGQVTDCVLLGSCADNGTDALEREMCSSKYKMQNGFYELLLGDGLDGYSIQQGWHAGKSDFNVMSVRRVQCKDGLTGTTLKE
jgi:hypothetical protein